MMKKYIGARKEILAERDLHSGEVHRTKYVTNPHYVYEPFRNDTVDIKRLRDSGEF